MDFSGIFSVSIAGKSFIEWLMQEVAGNTIGQYISALFLLIAAAAAIKVFEIYIIGRLKQLAQKTETKLDDLAIEIIENIGWPFYFVISLYAAMHLLSLPAYLNQYMGYAVMITVIFYALRAGERIVQFWTKSEMLTNKDASIVDMMGKIMRASLWVIAIALVLSNLGFEVSALVTGLGIGGIAIALAVQNILGDVFCSFSIHFDKPFQVGDLIVVGADKGVVKRIGLKTTRLETVEGEELVVSNQELTAARIHNYKRMSKRRTMFNIGVEYDTDSKKLRKIPSIIKEVVGRSKLAEFERTHFTKFGDFALIFEISYYVKSDDYTKYLDVQQEINYAIEEEFRKEKIAMAYPTQTLFLKK